MAVFNEASRLGTTEDLCLFGAVSRSAGLVAAGRKRTSFGGRKEKLIAAKGLN